MAWSTAFAIAWFLWWTVIMIVAQLWCDHRPNYPLECQELYDILHSIFPKVEFRAITDIWVLGHLLIFVLWIWLLPPKGRTRERLIRVFFFLWGTIYLLRSICLVLTQIPRTDLEGENARPDSIFWGVIGFFGTNPTMTDLVFSGHTATMVLVWEFVAYYTNHSIWSTLLWLFTVTGSVLVSITHMHYTLDVFIAWGVADWVFHRYHSILDPQYLLAWRPGYRLTEIPSGIELPATLTDRGGREFELRSKKKGKRSLNPFKYYTKARHAAWHHLKNFDGGDSE